MSEPDTPETPPPPAVPPPPPGYGAYPGGYPPPPPAYGYAPPPPVGPRNGLGIAALIVAIVALLTGFGGIVLGVVAIILGFLGWGRAKRGEATNGGMAVAGIVLGILSIILSIVLIGLVIWGFDRAGGTDYFECLARAGNDQKAVQECVDRFTDRLEDEFNVTIPTTP